MRGIRIEGDDRQRVIMVLPSSHRPSVEAYRVPAKSYDFVG